ncbi:MAG: DUF2182 domain-containing protein [Agrobacterium tumefaciens]|nr:DUF2182 domain-containing protein [Agrobacterium tumefaciens]
MKWRFIWRLLRQAPGPWLLLVSLIGWAIVSAHAFGGTASVAHHQHHGELQQLGHHAGIGVWLVMLLAMAPLVLRHEVALLWKNNLPRRRWPAILVFFAGYGLPWFVLGLVWVWSLAVYSPSGRVLVGALILLFFWHCAPLRQRYLNLCHRLPALRAFGGGMFLDMGRFGLRTGVLCCAICGPAMFFAMSLPAYHAAVMFAFTAIATIERYLPARRPVWRFTRLLALPEPRWRSLDIPRVSPLETI